MTGILKTACVMLVVCGLTPRFAKTEEIDLSTNLGAKHEIRDAQEAFLKTLGPCTVCKGVGVLGSERITCPKCGGTGKAIRPVWEGISRDNSPVLQSFAAFIAFIEKVRQNENLLGQDAELAESVRITGKTARAVFEDQGLPLRPAKVLTQECISIMTGKDSPKGKWVAFLGVVARRPPEDLPANGAAGLPKASKVYQLFLGDSGTMSPFSVFMVRDVDKPLTPGRAYFVLGVMAERFAYKESGRSETGHVVQECYISNPLPKRN